MLSNKKNIIVGERSNLFAVSPLRFLIIIFCLILSFRVQSRNGITAPGDSLKNKYDINDPRNPHCPCHQYQKQADEEYARLHNKEKNKEGNLSGNEFDGQDKKSVQGNGEWVTDKTFGRQNIFSNFFGFHYKKKKFNRRCEKTKGFRLMKYKISDKLSRCFHF